MMPVVDLMIADVQLNRHVHALLRNLRTELPRPSVRALRAPDPLISVIPELTHPITRRVVPLDLPSAHEHGELVELESKLIVGHERAS